MQLVGSKILWLNQVDSTNDFSLQMLSQQSTETGTVIATTNQVKGRGQRGNSWYVSPNQSLCFSIILTNLSIAASQQFIMNMAIALGVRNFIANELNDDKVSIKWPNDILVNGNKIAGILIENTLSGSVINNLVIGVGININQCEFDEFDFLRKPTSLRLHTHKEYELRSLLNQVLSHINAAVILFFSKNFSKIQSSYHEHLFQRNIFANYLYKEQETELMIIRVDDKGLLCLEDKNEALFKVNLQEIRFLS